MNNEPVIITEGLSRSFGEVEALRDLDLRVPRGSVFGYLGRNGSGKTTTIKLLLGLIKPDRGSARVLGFDPQTDPVPMRRRIGYVAESQQMYGWMTVKEIMRFTASLYPAWDERLAEKYLERFELSSLVKVKNLSKGQNARLALLLALAPMPELLILDDPTMGLDPVSRQEFLGDIVRAIQEEGRTVFFSTHILQELDQVADWVAILDRGRLLACAPVDHLKANMRRFELHFEGIAPGEINVEGILRLRRVGRDLVLTMRGNPEAIARELQHKYRPVHIEEHRLNLDEIFTETVLSDHGRSTPYLPVVEEELMPPKGDGATVDARI